MNANNLNKSQVESNSNSVLFEWFDNYIESKIGKKVLRKGGDVYDNRYNNVLITVCICYSDSKELIDKMEIYYHPYSLLSNVIKFNKDFTFYEIDKLRLQKGIDKLLNWKIEIISDFKFHNFADSMDIYWNCFKDNKRLSKITKNYYYKIDTNDIIRSNKGFIF